MPEARGKGVKLSFTAGATSLFFTSFAYTLKKGEPVIYYGRLYKLNDKEVNGSKGWAAVCCVQHQKPIFLFASAVKPAPRCNEH